MSKKFLKQNAIKIVIKVQLIWWKVRTIITKGKYWSDSRNLFIPITVHMDLFLVHNGMEF